MPLKYLLLSCRSFDRELVNKNRLVKRNFLPAIIYSMKTIQYNPHIIESSDCILNMLRVLGLSLILFNTSWEINWILKESKYDTVLLPINNEP